MVDGNLKISRATRVKAHMRIWCSIFSRSLLLSSFAGGQLKRRRCRRLSQEGGADDCYREAAPTGFVGSRQRET
jgi:hypothetical protein